MTKNTVTDVITMTIVGELKEVVVLGTTAVFIQHPRHE